MADEQDENEFGQLEFLMVMVSFMEMSPFILRCDFDGFIRYVNRVGNDGPIPGQKEHLMKLARLLGPVKAQMETISQHADTWGKSIEKAPTN